MNSMSTLELASTRIADAERRWLYGHPYRSVPSRRTVRALRGKRGRLAA
jgi:hypothetical protein